MSLEMTDYMENLVINRFFRNQAFTTFPNCYLALHSSSTSDAGGGTEASGGSYSRQPIVLAESTDGETTNTNTLVYSNMPDGSWIAASIWDATSGGNMLWHGPLPATKTTTPGQSIAVAVGDITIGFTGSSSATTWLRNSIINHLLRGVAQTPPATPYLALYTTTVGLDGSGMEVSGGSYLRRALSLTPPVGGVSTSTALLDIWMPTATIMHTALVTTSSGPTTVMSQAPLNTPASVTAGDQLRFNIGDISYSVR